MWEEKSCIYDIRPKAFGTIFFEKNIFLRNEGFILAWEIPWIEEPGRPQAMGLQEWDTTKQLNHQPTCNPSANPVIFIFKISPVSHNFSLSYHHSLLQ